MSADSRSCYWRTVVTVKKHDARIVAYMDKDEKEFEAEREEKEKSRMLGYDYIKALNKQRHEHQLMQKSKKFSAQVELNIII